GSSRSSACGRSSGTRRPFRRRNRDGRRSNLPKRRHTQHDIDAFFSFGGRIIFHCLFPEKVDRLANARVAKFNTRNNDRIQFARNSRRAARFSSKRSGLRANSLAVRMHGFFPAFLYLPKTARARFVIRLNAVLIFSVVDLSLAASSRCVLGI